MIDYLHPRLVLLLIWLFSFFISIIVIFAFVFCHYALLNSASTYLRDISGIYLPYLTPIIAFWFSENALGAKRQQTKAAAAAALLISSFFNVVMIGILFSVFAAQDGEGVIEDRISLMRSTATLLAFLVGPAVGFFFSGTRGKTRANTTAPNPSGAKTDKKNTEDRPA